MNLVMCRVAREKYVYYRSIVNPILCGNTGFCHVTVWEIVLCVLVCQLYTMWKLIFHVICPLQDRAKCRIVDRCGAHEMSHYYPTLDRIAEMLTEHRWIHEMSWCSPTINIQRNVLFIHVHINTQTLEDDYKMINFRFSLWVKWST